MISIGSADIEKGVEVIQVIVTDIAIIIDITSGANIIDDLGSGENIRIAKRINLLKTRIARVSADEGILDLDTLARVVSKNSNRRSVGLRTAPFAIGCDPTIVNVGLAVIIDVNAATIRCQILVDNAINQMAIGFACISTAGNKDSTTIRLAP